MRTTIDIPDELFRRAKSEAALQGRRLKDLVEEGLRLALAIEKTTNGEAKPAPHKPRPSAHDLLKDLIFDDVDSPADLSTNRQYFDDLGR